MVKGWKRVKLGSVVDILSGGTPDTTNKRYWNGNIKWCTPSDITKQNCKYLYHTEKTITEKGLKESAATLVPVGTILLCSRATIGEMSIAKNPVATNQGFKNLVCQNGIYNEFLYYALFPLRPQMVELAIGTTFLEISKTALQSIEMDIPELYEEQVAIAEALSDVDNLISALQNLIAKKKAIKEGAMQELLTGKKRLPGFSGEWREFNFAKSAKLKGRIGWQGLTTAEYLQSGYAYLITGTDFYNGKIKWETCHFVDEKRYRQDLNIQIQKDDILLTKDGTIGKVAYISDVPRPTTLNSGVFVIRPAKAGSFIPHFVYYVLNSFVFDDFLAKLSAGSTINHLYQKDFIDFTFRAPIALDEQQAIAQVLSDMDNEIEQLERKLAKYQQIKEGMMQELLTGRIRLCREVNDG